MKFLHTSDWHIGRSLYGRKRYDEFFEFLDWLARFIETHNIDALLVAGDVFDTSTPSNRSQELYYRFLCRVAASCCRHVVIIAGNHDSPSFLNAPKELLRAFNVHVVSSTTGNTEDEVIVLAGSSGVPEAIVCAVPYLRDRDIRVVRAGESMDDKNQSLIMGVRQHYADVGMVAQEKIKNCGNIPVIGMGHLFAAGGKTIDGDGVRELYVGSLAHVGKDVFPACVDYMALGHLHVPQKVGKEDHIRYSGSPIPMGYGEALQEKIVVSVEFDGRTPNIKEHCVPCFQALEKISGDLETIIQRIDEQKSKGSRAWLEIEYTGRQIVGNLRQLVEEAVADTGMEISRIKNKRMIERIINRTGEQETLETLDANDVFIRLLDTFDVEEKERLPLVQAYNEIVTTLHEQDKNAQ
ncbi:exonuclease SbcCD subunit D C-terminal domain-containing protein [Desulfobacula phenolica]|uniref:Nuclease SbcCD subunit D n=1 Tax=Desulfobacula phenolica TaxID=90732 RepID=A0A1H2IM97_9BACT|nr:exonuclease SbcCD subunit D C-terminal domain-containing protein [Desulfobacula phenolica]SDU45172.1 Exodeoxyribonuclease I subunit D [Desulfobacula phenolica]